MRVEYPEGNESLTEFILFFDRVYAYRSARWPASLDLNLPLLTGQSADCEDRILLRQRQGSNSPSCDFDDSSVQNAHSKVISHSSRCSARARNGKPEGRDWRYGAEAR